LAERGLAVGAGGHQAVAVLPPRRERVAEEGGDRVVPLILERLGRHGHPGVVGEQGEEVVEIAGLEGVGEARHHLTFVRGAG
jgi:hypothetical protein